MGKTRSKSRRKRNVQSIENASTESPELQAFAKHCSQLLLALNGGVISRLAWELHGNRILSRTEVEDINHEMLTDSARANKLINAIEKSITMDFSNFYNIVDSFYEHLELEPVAERMKKTNTRIRNKLTPGFEKYFDEAQPGWRLRAISCKSFFLGKNSDYVRLPSFHGRHNAVELHSHLIGAGDQHYSNITYPLPSAPKPFVGRANEMKQIISDLTNPNISIVGLFGPPAFGKSSLAIHAGHRMLQRQTPVKYFDLSELSMSFDSTFQTDSSHIYEQKTVVQTYNIMPTPFPNVRRKTVNNDLLLSWAMEIAVPSILILDNCDTVLNHWQQEFQTFVLELIDQSMEHLTIVITSQVEISFLDRFTAYKISESNQEASFSLINELYPPAPSTVHSELTGIRSELVELVGNCPLAIKVVVNLLKPPQSVSPTELIEQLKRNTIGVLTAGRLPKKDSFSNVMDTACQHLNLNLKKTAFYLSLFSGSLDEQILGLFQQLQIFNVDINELVARSLIERYYLNTGVRYKLHKLIRDYFNRNLRHLVNEREITTFNELFHSHYTAVFSDYIKSLNFTSPALKHQELFYREQHNFKHLLQNVQRKKTLTADEMAIMLLAYKEGLLERDSITPILLGRNEKIIAVCKSNACLSLLRYAILSLFSENSFLPCWILDNFDQDILESFNPSQITRIEALLSNAQSFCMQQMYARKTPAFIHGLCIHFYAYKLVYFFVQTYQLRLVHTIPLYVTLATLVLISTILWDVSTDLIWFQLVSTVLIFYSSNLKGALILGLSVMSLSSIGFIVVEDPSLFYINLRVFSLFVITNFLIIVLFYFPFVTHKSLAMVLYVYMSQFCSLMYCSIVVICTEIGLQDRVVEYLHPLYHALHTWNDQPNIFYVHGLHFIFGFCINAIFVGIPSLLFYKIFVFILRTIHAKANPKLTLSKQDNYFT